jgi:cation transporter-like permease
MTLVKSLIYGYAGAVLAGLLVAIAGVAFGLSEATVVAAATPTGVVLGTLGLAVGWRRARAARR